MSAETQHQRMTEQDRQQAESVWAGLMGIAGMSEAVFQNELKNRIQENPNLSRSFKLRNYHRQRIELLEEAKSPNDDLHVLYRRGQEAGLSDAKISRRLHVLKKEVSSLEADECQVQQALGIYALGLSALDLDSLYSSDYRKKDKVEKRRLRESMVLSQVKNNEVEVAIGCEDAAAEPKKTNKFTDRLERLKGKLTYAFGMMCIGLGLALGLSGSVKAAETEPVAVADKFGSDRGRQELVLDKPPELILPPVPVPTEIYAPVATLAANLPPKIRPVEMQAVDEKPVKAETVDNRLGVPLSTGGFLDLTQGVNIIFPSEWKVDSNKKPLYSLNISSEDVRVVDTTVEQASFAQESAEYRAKPLLTQIVPVTLSGADTLPNWSLVLMHSGSATKLSNPGFIGQIESLYGEGSYNPQKPQALPGEIFANLTNKNLGDVIIVNGTFFQVTSQSTIPLENATPSFSGICGSFNNGDYKCALSHAGIKVDVPGFALSTCSGEDLRDRKILGFTEYVPVQKEVREIADPGVQEAVRLADAANQFKFQREYPQMGTYLLNTYSFPSLDEVKPILEGVVNPATSFNNGMECQGWVSLRLGRSPLYTIDDPAASVPEEVKSRVARNVSGTYQDTARRQWVTGGDAVIGQGDVIFEPAGGQTRTDGTRTGHVAFVEYTGRDEKGTFYVISHANSDGNGMIKIEKIYASEMNNKFVGGIAVLQVVGGETALRLDK